MPHNVDSMESNHFWPSFLHVPLYKTFFFDFWCSPPNPQNLLPKIWTKLPISRFVWQIDWRCFGLPGGFRGWPIQWNHAKCCGADPCCHGNKIWARRRDPVTYRLVIYYLWNICLWNILLRLVNVDVQLCTVSTVDCDYVLCNYTVFANSFLHWMNGCTCAAVLWLGTKIPGLESRLRMVVFIYTL